MINFRNNSSFEKTLIFGVFVYFFFSFHTAQAIYISNINVANVTKTSADISWETDVPATSQVILVEENYSPIKKIPFSPSSPTKTHKVMLDNLLPNTKYVFYVASEDQSGTIVTSSNFNNPSSFNNFSTLNVDSGAPIDFRVDTKGPKNVYAGSDLYFSAKGVLLSGQVGSLYFKSVSGLPDSVGFHVICGYNENPNDESSDSYFSSDGMPWCYNRNNSGFSIRIRTSPSTPQGTYTAFFTVESMNLQKTFSYTFTVQPSPPSIQKINSVNAPEIPGIKKWENSMIVLGDKWCDLSKKFSFGYEGEVWFYDGARVYFQIADYTGDEKWLKCAQHILSQYRDDYINPGNGGSPAYKKFPHGLAIDYFKYGTPYSKLGVENLYRSVSTPYINAAAPVWGYGGDPNPIRELSFAISSMVMGERVGLPRSPFLPIAINMAIGYIDVLITEPNQINQSAFNGLLMESLIQYYELTEDKRIPPSIKRMLDNLWDNFWDQKTKKLLYNPMYVPPLYENTLINLTAPAFAWYWRLTGDNLYKQRGDEMFSHALDQDISFSGKIFSQNYRWSFDYVKWRSGAEFSNTNPSVYLNKDIKGPIISEPEVSVGPKSAVITWITDEPADTQVEYGLTDAYGMSSDLKDTLTLKTDHYLKVDNLLSNSVYNYRIKSKDSSGNLSLSDNRIFSTLKDSDVGNGKNTFSNGGSSGGNVSGDSQPNTFVSQTKNVFQSVQIKQEEPVGDTSPVYPNINNCSSLYPIGNITSVVGIGFKDENVLNLQKFLSTRGYFSYENITGYFGDLTERALKRFQSDEGIISYGDPISTGFGNAGPSTRARINSLINSDSISKICASNIGTQTGITNESQKINLNKDQKESIKAQIIALQQMVLQLLIKLQALNGGVRN